MGIVQEMPESGRREALRLVMKAQAKLSEAKGSIADYLAKYKDGIAAVRLTEAEQLLEKAAEALL